MMLPEFTPMASLFLLFMVVLLLLPFRCFFFRKSYSDTARINATITLITQGLGIWFIIEQWRSIGGEGLTKVLGAASFAVVCFGYLAIAFIVGLAHIITTESKRKKLD